MTGGNEKIEIYLLFFWGIGLFICLTGFIIYFLVTYRNKQLKNKIEKEALAARFQQELLQSRLEIQEQTLMHISQEIHDNVGQVLAFIKLSLGATPGLSENEKQERIDESLELVSHVINDLRDLSRSLNYETVAAKGLAETIRIELDRVNRAGKLSIELKIEGQIFPLGRQRELVMFRIFQECLQNTLKHAEAKSLKINLQYSPDLVNLIIHDDGKGFYPDRVDANGGMGLKNIQNRAKLIGATISINSSPGNGCLTSVSLNPSHTQVSFDGQNPSGIG